MLIPLLGGIITVLACFFVFVATRPARYQVSRSIVINSPPSAVFPHIDTLKNWEAWNPWGKLDPAMKLTYGGPPAGLGASYAWAGNNQVGEGKATIVASRPDESVAFRMAFLKPMAGESDTLFTFKPHGTQTEVTWAMTGTNNFFAKAFSLFVSMDKMIGGQFEKGLADLKKVVETARQ